MSDIREALCIRAMEVSLAVWSGTGTQGANHSSMGTAENDTTVEHFGVPSTEFGTFQASFPAVLVRYLLK